MDIIIVLIVVVVSGLIGFYVGRKKPVVIETKVVERVPKTVAKTPIPLAVSGRDRYRVESPEGDFLGDSASASEHITKLRARGKHGKLYLDDKLAKEF